MESIIFPEHFLFGAAICDYQHFGGSDCDLPRIPAAKHFTFFEDDFDLLKRLGLNAFRTSIEWARIEPEAGKIHEDSVNFYHRYLSRLKATGITTVVTLHHFTNPKWVHGRGGWLAGENVEKFLRHVDFVCQEFGEYIDYYVTINEPIIYTQLAYLVGEKGLPPYHRNRREAAQCLGNMNEAIRRGYDIIHERNSKAKVGVAHEGNPRILQKLRNTFRSLITKIDKDRIADVAIESWEGKYDFCGINYYCKKSYGKLAAYPEGLRKLCAKFFKEYGKPILITENGLPNRDDCQKTAYLILHLKELSDAIDIDRTDIIGYCWWSFLHGYEWGLGYAPFFALIDVDMGGSYTRTPTRTAHAYSEVIRNRGFPLSTYENHYLPLKTSIRFENWV